MKKLSWQSITIFLVTVFIVATGASVVSAAGFAVNERSVKGMGNAFAGGAAIAEDASTIYFNPAGLTRLAGTQLAVGTSAIAYSFNFTDRGSKTALGQNLTGGDGGDGGMVKIVPLFYYAHSLSENLKVGLGITAPFGLGTEYDADWVGRYHTIKSEVLTIDVNPSIAYRVDSRLSVGLGVSVQYIDAELNQALDFGLIGAFFGYGTTPQQLDGLATLAADDWGYGYNLGILYEFSEKTRFGLSYRSKVAYSLEGEATFVTPAAAKAIAEDERVNRVDTPGSTNIDMPGSISLSLFHQLNAKWAIMGDLYWMDWSILEELRIKFANGSSDSVEPFDWEDTLRWSLGATYTPNDKWIFRCGVAFDPTPIPEATSRSPRVPDTDRTWVSVGTTYQWTEKIGFDLGYTRILGKNTGIDRTTEPQNGTLKLDVEGTSHIVGFQFTWDL